eukprot:CAMPEP_0201478270 /NCGR_PEP_ID=MMETSP0151_2-20130828/3169_1 /ASSEMBLY_ACC=CAM_ASM_000257 /TAXON_ID=200890 /ORGANISM="Paramoeba atlantica, Strain 621/1 / CCAP 1560/9" /LENGTH=88 /DNA_ID=CAMNT_0047859311 /DNA_START=65 /DNA_END=331 /DNA_ORIENTATION=+
MDLETVQESVMNTFSYTHSGLQIVGKGLWVVSVGFVFLVLPLKHSLFSEDQFLKEQQMQREQMRNDDFSGLMPGGPPALDLSGLGMEQ